MSVYNKGLVSVVIPSYNRGKYLNQTIESLLDQTYPDIGLVYGNCHYVDADGKFLYRLYDDRHIVQGNRLAAVPHLCRAAILDPFKSLRVILGREGVSPPSC